jgi:hypothetical protein
VPQPDLAALHARLEAFAGARIEAAAREAANTALPRMKERFTEVQTNFQWRSDEPCKPAACLPSPISALASKAQVLTLWGRALASCIC